MRIVSEELKGTEFEKLDLKELNRLDRGVITTFRVKIAFLSLVASFVGGVVVYLISNF